MESKGVAEVSESSFNKEGFLSGKCSFSSSSDKSHEVPITTCFTDLSVLVGEEASKGGVWVLQLARF